MPLTLAKVLGATSEASFVYLDETVHIQYRSAALTPKLLIDLSVAGSFGEVQTADDLAKAGDAMQAMGDALSQLIASWDIAVDDSGALYPLDGASLAKLPLVLLFAIIGAILGALKLGEATAAMGVASDSAPSTASSPPSSLAD